jgi:hypothetical protein
MQPSGSQRQHRRAAWSVMLAGMAKRAGQSPRSANTPIETPAEPTPVEQVTAIIHAGDGLSKAALLAAARQVWPDAATGEQVELAVQAALALTHGIDVDAMRVMLLATAAEDGAA